jgi:hypothetical protein
MEPEPKKIRLVGENVSGDQGLKYKTTNKKGKQIIIKLKLQWN